MSSCNKNQEKTEEASIVEKKKSSSSSSIMRFRSPAYLVFHHGRNERSQTFFSLSDESYSVGFFSLSDESSVQATPEMRGTMCYASGHEWLVMADNYSNFCFLLNPVTKKKVELPPLEYHDFYVACVLTSSPHTTNCVVMFVSRYGFCKYCRPNHDEEWTEQNLITRDYNNGERDEYDFAHVDAAVSCRGKIYITFGGRGMAVMEQTGDGGTGDDDKGGLLFKIRLVIMKKSHEHRVHPLCFGHSVPHLVESYGNVFMVSKHYKGNSKEVFDFKVFRLDFLTMDWEHTIGFGDDRVFLLANTYSLSAAASTSEMKGGIMKGGNCIYFFEPEDRNLYKYCMKEEHISSFLPCPNVVRKWNAPYWMQPLV